MTLRHIQKPLSYTQAGELTLKFYVSPGHSILGGSGPKSSEDINASRQLVLTDRSKATGDTAAGIKSRRLWKTADLQSKADLMCQGFGFGSLPEHMGAPLVERGALRELEIDNTIEAGRVPLYLAAQTEALGPAGRQLQANLETALLAFFDQR